jgi:hypothetical protein
MAVERFDLRAADVVAEANAISSAHDRAALLRTPEAATLQAKLRDYATLRLRFGEANYADVGTLQQASAAQRARITEAALLAATPIATTALGISLLNTVDAVTDLGVTRETAINARLPSAVFWVLIGFMCVAITMTGYAFPPTPGSRSWGGLLLSSLLVVTLFLIIDLDRSFGGSTVVNQAPLANLVAEWNALDSAR